jgi:hypothetical protein
MPGQKSIYETFLVLVVPLYTVLTMYSLTLSQWQPQSKELTRGPPELVQCFRLVHTAQGRCMS